MKYNILTSFNQRYWDEVARENTLALDRNWSGGDIFLYHELKTLQESQLFSNRVNWLDLYQTCPEIKIFGEAWKDNPKANGGDGAGGNFRLNAIKFVHKTFAIWHRAKNQTSGWVVWLDCDAFVYKKIDEYFLRTVFPTDKMSVYVGRPGKYSECGFLGFNMSHPDASKFLTEWENLYLSGEFVNLPETHDSWTFDYIRKKWSRPELFLDLNAGTETNKNPFSHSKIGPYIMHSKGSDKGKQLERFKNRMVTGR